MKLGDRGFDSPQRNTGKTVELVRCDAESDATDASGQDSVILDDDGASVNDAGIVTDDAGLTAIVEAWPKLSADAQRAMVAFVERQLGEAGVALDSMNSARSD